MSNDALHSLRACGSALALALATTLIGCDPGEATYDEGCDEAALREVPVEAETRGPWEVGTRTVELAGLTAEVWYPAKKVDVSHYDAATYDLREYLSEGDRRRVSDDRAVIQTCNCYRDLEPDLSHGPYPVVVFLHSRGGFPTQSLPQMTHWASRGFVVISAELPGLLIEDALATACNGTSIPSDAEGDARRLIQAIGSDAHALEFLGDRLDTERIGVVGHSAGGLALASLGDVAQVLIPMAAEGVQAGKALMSTLILGGTADEIVSYDAQRAGYATSPPPKRLVGIRNAGHLAFTEICSLRNAYREGLVEVMIDAGICGARQLGLQTQCDSDLLPDVRAWGVINAATSAALGETLQCAPELADTFDELRSDRRVAELLERPPQAVPSKPSKH